MSPITQIWLFSLKDGHSLIEADFQGLWHDILTYCASYAFEGGDSHIQYQSDTNPAQLAMITGYPSLELNEDADRIYTEKYKSRAFDLVQHQLLIMLYLHVKELPLASGRVTILESDKEVGANHAGKGGWNCYEPLQHEEFLGSSGQRKTWAQITTTDEATELQGLGNARSFSMIMESHLSS